MRGTRPRALCAVLATTVAGTVLVAGCSTDDRARAGERGLVAAPAQQAVDPDEPTREDLDAVQRLLAVRAAAAVAGDERAFMRTVDPEQPRLRAQQRTLFRNLERLDLIRMSYDLDRETLLVAAKVPGKQKTFRPQIHEYVQLEGTLTDQLVNPVQMTFVQRRTDWYLGAENQRKVSTSSESPQERPWFGGPIAVRRDGTMTVIVDRSRADSLDGLVSSIRADIAYVADVLGEPPAYDVLVDATSNGLKFEFSELSKQEAAAVSFGLVGVGGKRVGSAIKLNPTRIEQVLDQDGLMRHELVHFLLSEFTRSSPVWLTEGIASYVEFYPSDFSRLQVSDEYFDRLMAADRRLPIIGLFGIDPPVSYPISQAAVKYLVSRSGLDRLKDLMRAYRREYDSVNVDAHTPRLLRKLYDLREKDVVDGAFAELAKLNH
jgi:hypothetical protein